MLKIISVLLALVLVVSISSVCLAENYARVAIRKSTGKLIEYQTGDAPLGTLTKNAIKAGIPANDIEEKYVTPYKLEELKYEWITKPKKDKAEKRKKELKAKEELIRQKLNLTAKEMESLKEILK